MRQFFIENALCWLEEYRFDGLRLDAVDEICDDSSPHFLAELATTVRERIPDRHVHLVLENDDNCASWLERSDCTQAGSSESSRVVGRYTAQWNDDYHHAAHVLATGETSGYYADYAHQPTAALGRALAQGFVFQGDYSSYRDRIRGQPSTALPPLAFVNFLQNHDQIGNRASGERLCRLASADAISALTAVHLLAPAIPLLFMGEEWNATQPFLYFCDYHDELADVVRSGRHREFGNREFGNREFGKFAAFADTQAQERIPDPNAEATSGP